MPVRLCEGYRIPAIDEWRGLVNVDVDRVLALPNASAGGISGNRDWHMVMLGS
jgi:hypothetical protein